MRGGDMLFSIEEEFFKPERSDQDACAFFGGQSIAHGDALFHFSIEAFRCIVGE